MGKIEDYQGYFLENGGRKLGYDEDNMPEMKDIEVVMTFHIPIWDYNGQTEEEYYSKQVFPRGEVVSLNKHNTQVSLVF